MSLRSDHKALIFLASVAVLGAGVRVVRASGHDAPTDQPALDRQMQSADSSAAAQRAAQSGRVAGSRGRGTTPRAKRDTAHRARDTVRKPIPTAGLLDRRGYVGRKLDLDVATAAQIDSLPGVSPAMAKRIVLDREHRGPFLNASGLRRVTGVGGAFLRAIDTLVTFSGTIAFPSPEDTVIRPPKKSRPGRGSP